MSEQPDPRPNDAPVRIPAHKSGNPWIDQNWQKAVAWLWQRKNVDNKPRFISDAVRNALGKPPDSTDINSLLSKLRAAGLVEPTKMMVRSSRRKGETRIWRIL